MPQYRIINGRTFLKYMHEVGEVVGYDGWPGSSLEPVDDVAKRIKSHYDEGRAAGRKFPKPPDLAAFADPPPAPAPVPVPMRAVAGPQWNTQPEGAPTSAPAAPDDPPAVDIPDGWHSLSRNARRALAQKLGAPASVTVADADEFIAERAAKGPSNA